MADNEVSVSNSKIGDKLVGRDDNSLNFTNQYSGSAYLEDLYLKFEVEKNANPELKALCDELNFLNTQVQNEKVIGLEAKLIAGNKQPIVDYALELKQKFYMKLMRTSQYSMVAQDINIYILSKIKRTFIMEIFTMICAGESELKINMLIAERIINPVKTDLGINLFKYTEEDIMGMIFYLTGNCHIKWAS
ncbi:hypothetical protein HK413_05235 [Mucilaginibacter sp. S1162]|uniref:ABC-three component systems C-terminal domain-containing protein n=1 Tax=Mucilaginibacter humi TaxID=2732510 RepID=A0ABX1W0F3_9SPHI|nr:ABC-three component system protein [Mucilaginibacter humi]NNU33699.1 hypothetical protein [Mucilaginibacter humi]